MARRLAQIGGDGRLEHGGAQRLQQTGLLRAPDAPGIDRDENVGRAVGALGAHALHELVGVGLDAVHANAGCAREIRVDRLVGVVMARRVEIDGAGRLRAGRAEGRPAAGNCCKAAKPNSAQQSAA